MGEGRNVELNANRLNGMQGSAWVDVRESDRERERAEDKTTAAITGGER